MRQAIDGLDLFDFKRRCFYWTFGAVMKPFVSAFRRLFSHRLLLACVLVFGQTTAPVLAQGLTDFYHGSLSSSGNLTADSVSLEPMTFQKPSAKFDGNPPSFFANLNNRDCTNTANSTSADILVSRLSRGSIGNSLISLHIRLQI